MPSAAKLSWTKNAGYMTEPVIWKAKRQNHLFELVPFRGQFISVVLFFLALCFGCFQLNPIQ